MNNGMMGGGRRNIPEKPKDFKKSMSQLLKFCKPFLPAMVIAMALAIIGSIFTIVGPSIISAMTDIITDGLLVGIDLKALTNIAIFLLCLYALGGVFSYAQTFIMATVTQKITKSLRGSISRKINKLPLRYFDTVSYGDTLSRVTNDVDTIGNTLSQSVVSLITAFTLLIGTVIMMFVNNWIMALTAIGASVIGFAIMMLIMAGSQKYFISQQRLLGEINGHVEEIYSGHNVVKVYNGEADASKKFDTLNKNLYNSGWKSQFFSGLMMPLMNFIGNFGYVAVCVVGGLLAFNNKISFGVIVAFMMYVRLFTQPLNQIAQTATNLQSTAAASGRVFDFLNSEEMPEEIEKTIAINEIKGDVEFRNVKFGYDSNKTIINNFSAHALPGQKIAIVGPTGAGKTTMVNLLMHFYDVDSGEILIDGIPTSKLTRTNIHDLFGMVLQDTWTFEGTIRDNIVYSKKGATDEQVESVCKAVGLAHYIKTLPNGYDQIIDDKANLSQGQKQLLTIARAMIENAPMLILDEATSSVDTRTEVIIQKAMDALTQGRTSFVIAHRLSTIKNADLILVMKDGDIIEQGNHEELLAKKGFYSELYNSQFENVG